MKLDRQNYWFLETQIVSRVMGTLPWFYRDDKEVLFAALMGARFARFEAEERLAGNFYAELLYDLEKID